MESSSMHLAIPLYPENNLEASYFIVFRYLYSSIASLDGIIILCKQGMDIEL